jgi:hypothetical protein
MTGVQQFVDGVWRDDEELPIWGQLVLVKLMHLFGAEKYGVIRWRKVYSARTGEWLCVTAQVDVMKGGQWRRRQYDLHHLQ